MAYRLEGRVIGIRTLESEIIIRIAVLLTLTGLTIYLQVSRKRSFLLTSISVMSFFIGIVLFSLLMETANLDLPVEKDFRQLRTAALVLGLATVIISVIHLVLRQRKDPEDNTLSPDLSAVFEVLEDITVISDIKGNLLEMKQPQGFMLFTENCKTFEDIRNSLKNDAGEGSMEAFEHALQDLSQEHQFELSFQSRQQEYLVRITPILSSRGKRTGTALLFHDIYKEKQMIRVVQAYNQSLTAANTNLTHYL